MNARAPVILLLALSVGAGGAIGADWLAPSRKLPPPAHVSPALRDRIAATPAPAAAQPAPASVEQWKALVRAGDEASGRYAASIAQQTGATILAETIAGVPVYRVKPARPAPEHAGRLFVNIHGGAWAFGGGSGSTIEAIMLAAKLGIETLAIDYRRPPDHPFPAALDDIVAVWRALAAERPAASIALGGTSAGGNLTLAATRRLLDAGVPAPGALMIGTPVIDLAVSGDSRFVNDGVDSVLVWPGVVAGAAALYAGGRSLSDPAVSPAYADVTGFPPTYLISGSRDLLLSDTIVMHRKLRRAGVAADLHVYEGMAHSDYLRAFGLPESDEHFAELDAFLKRTLAR